MNKKLLFFLMALLPFYVIYAQPLSSDDQQPGSVTGRVLESQIRQPLTSIIVSIEGRQVLTDHEGRFTISGLRLGSAEIVFSGAGFITKTLDIEVKAQTRLDDVFLIADLTETEKIPEINLEMIDMDDDAKAQNITGLLHSTGDVFLSFASYTFGQAWFRNRGYDAEFTPTYVGNSMINDAETGRTLWAIWGGLNDATRNSVSTNGLEPTNYSFGSIGGVSKQF
ncbi:MAG TPA: carboxypeptidase regulatory-like domain-containing protein [Bacteroidales bacterium]|nr:carboxypeptidase regulatory-like domain-containing protein [Bacteroidales bacterium]